MTIGNAWQTPTELVEQITTAAPIVLDPCSVETNPVGAEIYLTPRSNPDGLSADWRELARGGLTYANIPYGRGLVETWVDKILVEAKRGTEILALVRADFSTQWGRALIPRSDLVIFPKRIRFRGAQGSPNFANALVYLGPRVSTFGTCLFDLGPMVSPAGALWGLEDCDDIPTHEPPRRGHGHTAARKGGGQ